MTAMLATTVVRIWKANRAVLQFRAQNQDEATKTIRRVILFVIVLTCILVILVEWRFQMEARGFRRIETDVLTWVVCKVKIELGLGTGVCLGERSPTGIVFNQVAFVTTIIAVLGTTTFLTFGLDRDNYRVWPVLYRFAREGKWDQIITYIRYGPTNSNSASSMHKSSDRNKHTDSSLQLSSHSGSPSVSSSYREDERDKERQQERTRSLREIEANLANSTTQLVPGGERGETEEDRVIQI